MGGEKDGKPTRVGGLMLVGRDDYLPFRKRHSREKWEEEVILDMPSPIIVL